MKKIFIIIATLGLNLLYADYRIEDFIDKNDCDK